MNAEQVEKAIQLCHDLQAHALNGVVQSVKAGQRLGMADLRLVQDIRKQLETQRTFAKGTEEWLPLDAAAERLGVNVRTLQMWCSGKDALHQPALPHRKEGRRVLLPLYAAHAHLTEHAKRLALKSIDPAGNQAREEPAVADAEQPADLILRLELTLTRMSQSLMATPHGLRLYSQTLKNLEEAKARREAGHRNVTKQQLVGEVHSVLQCYVDLIEKTSPVLVKQMHDKIKASFGIDLWRMNCSIIQFMDVEVRIWANKVTMALVEQVNERIRNLERNVPDATCPRSPPPPEPVPAATHADCSV